MPLQELIALDTETDKFLTDKGFVVKTCMIQVCPIDAVTLDDVRVYLGLDCFEQFFHSFEETSYNVICDVCNLPYEFSRMKRYVIEHYTFVEYEPKMKLGKGQWTISADNMTAYVMRICNSSGHYITFYDDLKRLGNCSMKEAGLSVFTEHPEWFEVAGLKRVKTKTAYNDGWFARNDEAFIRYGKIDAYTQAMIMRYVHVNSIKALTSASNGFITALLMRYRGKTLDNSDHMDKKYALMDFKKYYPPLDRREQDIVEDSLLGGFVYGETGWHKGVFCHVDYSSSYPYEYNSNRMGKGRVMIVTEGFDAVMKADLVRYLLVSFKFKFKNTGGMPSISGRECRTESEKMLGRCNKKMKEGCVVRRLYTESYLEELKQSYELSDLVIHEIWCQKPCCGDFSVFIQRCYDDKTKAKKGSMKKKIAKLNMNGGIHGKTITKTHRKERTFYDGVEEIHESVQDPEYQSLIGFSAMMNARCRLLKDCRLIQEAGYKVMMCDTDSMIVNTTADNVRKVLGDKISKETKTIQDLGKFEFELDEDNKEEFDELKCWGLKRYCEMNNGKYRKSAFAGMKDMSQKLLLMQAPVEIGKYFEWVQTGSYTEEEGKNIDIVCKTACAENIYDEGPFAKTKNDGKADIQILKTMARDVHGIE